MYCKNTHPQQTLSTATKTLDTSSLTSAIQKPTREEAEAAVRTLLAWTGDNPNREGLLDTPRRVVDAYDEFFSGYHVDPKEILSRTYEECAGYDEMVLLKKMRIESHCEHHMVPFLGYAHVAYMPDQCIVGISKIARLVDAFAKRLQTQEILTVQIAQTLLDVLRPKGVAILIDTQHQCMTTRGVHKSATSTITTRFLGCFKEDRQLRAEFMQLIGSNEVG